MYEISDKETMKFEVRSRYLKNSSSRNYHSYTVPILIEIDHEDRWQDVLEEI